jgi:hypothetical protein
VTLADLPAVPPVEGNVNPLAFQTGGPAADAVDRKDLQTGLAVTAWSTAT